MPANRITPAALLLAASIVVAPLAAHGADWKKSDVAIAAEATGPGGTLAMECSEGQQLTVWLATTSRAVEQPQIGLLEMYVDGKPKPRAVARTFLDVSEPGRHPIVAFVGGFARAASSAGKTIILRATYEDGSTLVEGSFGAEGSTAALKDVIRTCG